MPGTFGNNRSLGYAFVNLINVETMKDWWSVSFVRVFVMIVLIVFFSKECHNVVICQKGFVLKGGVSILAEGSFLGHLII